MQYAQFFAARQDTGTAIPTPTVAVYLPNTSTLAVIYDKSGAVLANPFTGTAQGLVAFSAPNGAYDVQITSGAYVAPLIQGLQLFDPAGAFPTTSAGAIAAIGLFTGIAGLSIPASTSIIQTSGYSTPGVGAARYTAVANPPAGILAGPTTTQSADGRWWTLTEAAPTAEMCGPVGAGADQVAVTAGLAMLTATAGSGKLLLAPRTYSVNGPVKAAGPGLTVEGQGRFSTAILSSTGTDDGIQFSTPGTSNLGGKVAKLALGVAPGVTPTAGKLIEFNQTAFAHVEEVASQSLYNGIRIGGGNGAIIEHVNLRSIYGARGGVFGAADGKPSPYTASPTAGQSTVPVSSTAGLLPGMFVFGVEAWQASQAAWLASGSPAVSPPFGFVPNQPNTPFASNVQIYAVDPVHSTVSLATGVMLDGNGNPTSGTPAYATASLTNTPIEFAINGSIYGYGFWLDDSSKAAAGGLFTFEDTQAYATNPDVIAAVTPQAGLAGYRNTGLGSIYMTNGAVMFCEVGQLYEPTGPAVPGTTRPSGCNYINLLNQTGEHNNNPFVIVAAAHFRVSGGSHDWVFGSGVIGGADANGNICQTIPIPMGDITYHNYAFLGCGGHGFELHLGTWTLDDVIVCGASNIVGLPNNNNQFDCVHVFAPMAAAPYKTKIVNSQLGGYGGLPSSGSVGPVSGTCPAATGNANTVYLPAIFRTGPNGVANLPFTVLSGTGAGQTFTATTTAFSTAPVGPPTGVTTVAQDPTAAPGVGVRKNYQAFYVASVAGISLGDHIFAPWIRPGDTVQNIDPVKKIIYTNYNILSAQPPGTAVQFGAGYNTAQLATPLATPLDATSRLQCTQLTSRFAVYFEGGPGVGHEAEILNNNMRGNISGAIGSDGAVIRAGCVALNAGIDDIIPLVLVPSGQLGLYINPTQRVAAGSPTITKIVKAQNAAHLPLIQIPGHVHTLLPSGPGATISAVAGNNVANSYTTAPGQPMTLKLDDAGLYWASGGETPNATTPSFFQILSAPPATPTTGQVYYDSALGYPRIYTGAAWEGFGVNPGT